MTTAEQINDAATWLVIAGIIPSLAFTLIYGFGSPWFRSALGVVMFLLGLSLTTVLSIVLARRLFNEYPGYQWVAIGGYSLLLVAMVGLAVIVIIERRSASTTLSFPLRKADSMTSSSLTPGPDHSADDAKASFFETARKAFVAAGAALVATGGSQVALILADGKIEQAECWASAGIVVAATFIAFAGVYQTTNKVPAAQLGQVEGSAPGVLPTDPGDVVGA